EAREARERATEEAEATAEAAEAAATDVARTTEEAAQEEADATEEAGEEEGGGQAPVDPEVAEAVRAAADEVLAAVRDRDSARLRELSAPALQSQTDAHPQDVTSFFDCMAQGTVVEPALGNVSGDQERARIEVNFEIERLGETLVVARLWEFERQPDGQWLLFRLPLCPPE
ncbi:MAG: hypothetical protein U1B78_05130, partial [Dehalococcoidia bacterium]|nr:hypothetical protein [Dehalococcoidia bacterium]